MRAHLSWLREMLPSPAEAIPPDTGGLAAACVIRAIVEFKVALDTWNGTADEGFRSAALAAQRARSVADLGRNHDEAHQAEAILLAIESIQGVRAGHEPAQLERLIELIEDDRTPRDTQAIALTALEVVLDHVPAIRPALKASLLRVSALTAAQQGDRLMESFRIHHLLVRIMLADGDVDTVDRSGLDLQLALLALLRMAATVTTHSPRRDRSGTPMALAEALCLEAAVQFIVAGRLTAGILLAASCTAVMESNAVLFRDRDDTLAQRIADLINAVPTSGLVTTIPGKAEIVVLSRVPGEEWQLVGRHPAAILERLVGRRPLGHETANAHFALRRWIEGLAPIVQGLPEGTCAGRK